MFSVVDGQVAEMRDARIHIGKTEYSNGEDDEGLAVLVKAGCCSFVHAGD